jgi:crotonobetainyl-CoA:carnitine CoA-transferase CaiB-like acyl-CoA transferase
MSERPSSRAAPLSGVRVIDLSRVLAGPACCRVLSDLGADVIKVEPPEGDVSRLVAPKDDRGMSGLYTLANAGKRNISVDLRAPGAAALVLDLARRSDLVVENFRPGVLERMGLGFEVLEQANPRIVLLSISGFGSRSAWRDRPAYAPMMHAVTGVLQYQSEWSGLPLAHLADNKADMSAALHGAIGALAALRVAELTGRGQHVEVPLFDALLSTYSETPFALLPEPRHRDECPLLDAGPNGWIAVAGPPQNAWHRLRSAFALEDPARPDDDIPTKARLRQRAMEKWMASRPSAAELLERLEEAGLAAGEVRSLAEALTGPLAKERELLVHLDDRRGATRPVVRAPYWFGSEVCPVRRPAPRRGEHNVEVLQEVLGYTGPRIEGLLAAGVLCDDSKAMESSA